MASKLRIASRILECLDDPEAAVQDCLVYLKELQDIPAVQAMFSVWYDSDKGITSRLRARFNQTKRNVNVESIQMSNALLLNLAIKFTNMNATGCLEWPTIKIGKAIIYHPVLYNSAVLKEFEENDRQMRQSPWMWKFHELDIKYLKNTCSALTSKGEILSVSVRRADSVDITTKNGGCKLFCTIHSEENDAGFLNKICCFAVDENDNVFIVIEIPSCYENVPTKYKLLTLDANGNVKADRLIDIIEEAGFGLQMSVTKDGRIVIYSYIRRTMYICDSTNAIQDYKFTLPLKNVNSYDIRSFSFTVSNKNEIICTFCILGELKKFYMYIITMNGELKRAVQIPATVPEILPYIDTPKIVNILFNVE